LQLQKINFEDLFDQRLSRRFKKNTKKQKESEVDLNGSSPTTIANSDVKKFTKLEVSTLKKKSTMKLASPT
jgi:hypothetical protein